MGHGFNIDILFVALETRNSKRFKQKVNAAIKRHENIQTTTMEANSLESINSAVGSPSKKMQKQVRFENDSKIASEPFIACPVNVNQNSNVVVREEWYTSPTCPATFGRNIFKELTNNGQKRCDLPHPIVDVSPVEDFKRYDYVGQYISTLYTRPFAYTGPHCQVSGCCAVNSVQLVQKQGSTNKDPERVKRMGLDFTVYHHLYELQGIYIPKIIHFDENTHTILSLTMYNEGSSLDRLPENFKLSEEAKQSAVVALQAVHNAGILHGNLHPSHLILSKDESSVKLISFGKASLCEYVVLYFEEFVELFNILKQF